MTLNDNNQNQMNSINNTDIIDKLNIYYNIYSNEIPEHRIKSEFMKANYHGFFKGIIEYGDEMFKNELDQLLNNELQSQSENADNNENLKDPKMPSKDINAFFEKMFSYYIIPFHKNYNTDLSICQTPIENSLNSSSKSVSLGNSGDNIPEISHWKFRKAAQKRDGVCLFCWTNDSLNAAHIIAQKIKNPVVYDESSILSRAHLQDKHQVQNGLLLCLNCHDKFDQLKSYVDIADEKFVLKVVNKSILPNDAKHNDWKDQVRMLKLNRSGWQPNWTEIDQRLAVESNEEMGLYFLINDEDKLPNKKALEFHKAACLIWRMAGGAESDDEYCSDDEELGQVNTAELKERYNWKNSDETMNMPLLSE